MQTAQNCFCSTRMGYSVAETAKLLGVSSRSIRRLLDRKLLKGSRALRTIIIPRSEIEKFLTDTSEVIQ